MRPFPIDAPRLCSLIGRWRRWIIVVVVALAVVSACATPVSAPVEPPLPAPLPSLTRPGWGWQRCVDPASETPRAASTDAAAAREPNLVGGIETARHPEVGRIVQYTADDALLNRCTATLVAPDVVITAAHCTREQTPIIDEYFAILLPSGEEKFFAIIAYWATPAPGGLHPDARFGDDDIGLGRLAEAVPDDVAHPVVFADRTPAAGEQVEQFGYGCTRRASSEGLGVKRVRTFIWAPEDERPQSGCSGDSGGPLLMSGNHLFALHSGGLESVARGRVDQQAKVTAFRRLIDEQLARWRTPAAERMKAPPPPKPSATSAGTRRKAAACSAQMADIWHHQNRAICSSFTCHEIQELKAKFKTLAQCDGGLAAREQLRWLVDHPHRTECGVTAWETLDALEAAGLGPLGLELFEDPATLQQLSGVATPPWFVAILGARLKYSFTGEINGSRVLLKSAILQLEKSLEREEPSAFRDRMTSDLECARELDAVVAAGRLVTPHCGQLW